MSNSTRRRCIQRWNKGTVEKVNSYDAECDVLDLESRSHVRRRVAGSLGYRLRALALAIEASRPAASLKLVMASHDSTLDHVQIRKGRAIRVLISWFSSS